MEIGLHTVNISLIRKDEKMINCKYCNSEITSDKENCVKCGAPQKEYLSLEKALAQLRGGIFFSPENNNNRIESLRRIPYFRKDEIK